MKTKFKFGIALALASIVAISTVGCKTSSLVASNPDGTLTTNKQTTFLGTVITPAGVYSQFRGGNAQAAMIALRADPASLPYLNALHQVLQDTITSGSYDPVALSAAISVLPLKQVHNPAALEAIQTGFALWQMFEPIIQQQISGRNPFIIPALQGIADGIGDALGTVPVQTPAPAPSTNAPAVPKTGMIQTIHISRDLAHCLAQFNATGKYSPPAQSLASN